MLPYPDAKKKGTLASPATARANKVFPVPGGLGGDISVVERGCKYKE